MQRQRPDNKNGIALILVLGFLVIVALMGISFAVLMRTERLAARNYADLVRARHLTQVALARAFDALEEDVKSGGSWSPMPPWKALVSGGGSGSPSLISGEAEKHVHALSLPTVKSEANAATWKEVTDPVSGQTIGRIAYAVVNSCGYIDASVAGGADREKGETAAEMDLSQISDFRGKPYDIWLAARKGEHKQYETFSDLSEVLTGSTGGRYANAPLQDLHVYARSLPHARVNPATRVVTMPVDINRVDADEATIRARFATCGISDVNTAILNLKDYIDGDDVPQNVDSACTEAVPMIYEVAVSNYVEAVDAGAGSVDYVHRVVYNVELWYPFPAQGGISSFEVRVVAPPTIQALSAPAGSGIVMPPVPAPILPPSFTPQPYGFNVVEIVYEQTVPTPFPRPSVVGVRLTFPELEVVQGGDRVDHTPALPQAIRLPNLIGLDTMAPGGIVSSVNGTVGFSCIDPRINWRTADWSSAAVSLGRVNPISEDVNEGVSPMFVRNAPLEHVWELGFLSVGQPWRTIALYDYPAKSISLNPVLDHFYATTPETEPVRGRVFLGTKNPEALAAAFFKAPELKYPDETIGPSTSRLSWDAAGAIGNALVNDAVNLSDVGKAGQSKFSFGKQLSDAQIEAVIGNSVGLLTPRDNLFTVVVAAQALTGADVVVAEQRALALVWRDPYPPSASDREQPFIRYFKWLTE